jgi:hypothetical protein
MLKRIRNCRSLSCPRPTTTRSPIFIAALSIPNVSPLHAAQAPSQTPFRPILPLRVRTHLGMGVVKGMIGGLAGESERGSEHGEVEAGRSMTRLPVVLLSIRAIQS